VTEKIDPIPEVKVRPVNVFPAGHEKSGGQSDAGIPEGDGLRQARYPDRIQVAGFALKCRRTRTSEVHAEHERIAAEKRQQELEYWGAKYWKQESSGSPEMLRHCGGLSAFEPYVEAVADSLAEQGQIV
jgi:hypothetical protein